MVTISICNQKGGVGKTSVGVNLIAGIHHLRPNLRILAVDIDPQGHLSFIFFGRPDTYDPQKTVSALFQKKRYTALDIIHRTRFKTIDIIPSNLLLFTAREQTTLIEDSGNRLLDYLKVVESAYDLVVIDTPPDLGVFVINGLMAANFVLVPTDLGYLSVLGITDLWKTIHHIREKQEMHILGVLPNKYNRRLREHNSIIKQLKKILGDSLLEEQAISVNAPMSRAIARGQTIFEYDTKARSHKQFRELSVWVLDQIGLNEEV